MKIYGIYRVKLNASHGKAYKFDFLVMPNLFYGRPVTGVTNNTLRNLSFLQVYDFKGLQRGRFIDKESFGIMQDANLTKGWLFS